jgi:hypothetical protein
VYNTLFFRLNIRRIYGGKSELIIQLRQVLSKKQKDMCMFNQLKDSTICISEYIQ